VDTVDTLDTPEAWVRWGKKCCHLTQNSPHGIIFLHERQFFDFGTLAAFKALRST